MNSYLNPSAIASYHGMLTREARLFSKRLIDTPNDLFKHIRRSSHTRVDSSILSDSYELLFGVG